MVQPSTWPVDPRPAWLHLPLPPVADHTFLAALRVVGLTAPVSFDAAAPRGELDRRLYRPGPRAGRCIPTCVHRTDKLFSWHTQLPTASHPRRSVRPSATLCYRPPGQWAGPQSQRTRLREAQSLVQQPPVCRFLVERRGPASTRVMPHFSPDEPPEQQVVVELFHEQPLAPHRVMSTCNSKARSNCYRWDRRYGPCRNGVQARRNRTCDHCLSRASSPSHASANGAERIPGFRPARAVHGDRSYLTCPWTVHTHRFAPPLTGTLYD